MLVLRQPELRKWEVRHSSLAKLATYEVTYEQCRKFACQDISDNLTKITCQDSVIEIPKGTDFHFIGRVDTNWNKDDPFSYYNILDARRFMSFSTICNKNVSHFGGGLFYIYDILPDEIVHIFPTDSDTHQWVRDEEHLTWLPSLWLTLHDLEQLTFNLGVYNQVTCKTKRDGKLIKPTAIAAFEQIGEDVRTAAGKFEIPIVLLHADDDAINYCDDLVNDKETLIPLSDKIMELYGISLKKLVDWGV